MHCLTDEIKDKIAALLPEDAIREMEAMSGMTTLRLGGPAEMVCEPQTVTQVQSLLHLAAEYHIPVLPIGRGSNLLVRDGGLPGIVISTRRLNNLVIDRNTITAGAGVPLSVLTRRANEQGLAGLTFAGGIPGSVGGAVLMNAGAYGGEMKQVVCRVSGYLIDGTPFTYRGDEMGFAHRTSRLQAQPCVICEVQFQLTNGEPELLNAETAEYNARRRDKQPLDMPSAGSTFRRPANGYASAMIDECGLKGYTVGGAQVSTKHAGFCVNLGGTSRDFLMLIEKVQQIVLEKTGTLLQPQVMIVGVQPNEEGMNS